MTKLKFKTILKHRMADYLLPNDLLTIEKQWKIFSLRNVFL